MFRLVSTLLIAFSVSALVQTHAEADWLNDQKDSFVLGVSCVDGEWLKTERSRVYVDEAKTRGLDCNNDVSFSLKNENEAKRLSGYTHRFILLKSCTNGVWHTESQSKLYVDEAKKRSLNCAGLGVSNEVEAEGKNRITAKKVGKVLQSVGEDIQSIEVDSLAKGVAKAVWGAVEFCALTACTYW